LVIVILVANKKDKSNDNNFDNTKYSDFASYRAEFKGALGEALVASELGQDIKDEKYIINDLTLSDKDNRRSTQIDHIVITRAGIFVIETKNHSGKIYGSQTGAEWTQYLSNGDIQHKLRNPIIQNQGHIKWLYNNLKSIAKLDWFVSIVVFVDAQIFVETTSAVVDIDGLKNILSTTKEQIITTQQMQAVHQKLLKLKDTSTITKDQHIANIHNMKNSIDINICPRCGKKLVKRNGKYGEFYGCSGYPKCTFIKKDNFDNVA